MILIFKWKTKRTGKDKVSLLEKFRQLEKSISEME
jgi:hypothetical protein